MLAMFVQLGYPGYLYRRARAQKGMATRKTKISMALVKAHFRLSGRKDWQSIILPPLHLTETSLPRNGAAVQQCLRSAKVRARSPNCAVRKEIFADDCELCAQELKLGYRSFWTIAGHSCSQTSFEGVTGQSQPRLRPWTYQDRLTPAPLALSPT